MFSVNFTDFFNSVYVYVAPNTRPPDGCPTTVLMNGRISDVQLLNATSAIITYECFVGFRLEGSNNVLCIDGEVLPPIFPECFGKCKSCLTPKSFLKCYYLQ